MRSYSPLIIAEVVDECTGAMDVTATLGSLLTVRGFGLKIEGDDLHKTQVGLWFDDRVRYRLSTGSGTGLVPGPVQA
jgi:hypothetical protein